MLEEETESLTCDKFSTDIVSFGWIIPIITPENLTNRFTTSGLAFAP